MPEPEPAGLLLLAVMEKKNPACPEMQRCGCEAMSSKDHFACKSIRFDIDSSEEHG